MSPAPTFRPCLKLEALEARDVPALLVAQNGGDVMITEIGGDAPFVALDSNGQNPTQYIKPANTPDRMWIITAGGSVLFNSDDIFVRRPDGALVNVGDTYFFGGAVTSVNIDLQLGGDDVVSDSTSPFTSVTINGGPGNDSISYKPMKGYPPALLAQLILQPGGINPALFPALLGLPHKTYLGGAGDDTLLAPPFGLPNVLDGGDGNDILGGGFGPDLLIGGNGTDVLFGQGGNDVLLAQDFAPDFVFNLKGDTVLHDPFDVLFGPPV